MQIRENEAGGTTIILGEDDRLDSVPDSHKDILSDEIRKAFENPIEHFRNIAARCEFSKMAEWLRAVTTTRKWKLLLEEGFLMERVTQGGFFFWSDQVSIATVSPAVEARPSHPIDAFSHYYSLVDVVHWDSFGHAGGLVGSNSHVPIEDYGVPCRNKSFPTEKTFVWGSTPGGDMLIYSLEGIAGFLSHENGKAYSLGPVDQGIDWIFNELLEGRTPEFDYQRV